MKIIVATVFWFKLPVRFHQLQTLTEVLVWQEMTLSLCCRSASGDYKLHLPPWLDVITWRSHWMGRSLRAVLCFPGLNDTKSVDEKPKIRVSRGLALSLILVHHTTFLSSFSGNTFREELWRIHIHVYMCTHTHKTRIV